MQLGSSGPAFDNILTAATTLRSKKLASTAAIQILHGSTAVRCARGEYELALDDAMLAKTMALRLGNDLALATAVGNLSLCFGRLGNYQAQIEWSEKGMQHLGKQFTGYRDIQLGFARAFGNAMLGRASAALSAVGEVEARIPNPLPDWLRQAWHLYRADVFQLLGKKREALSEAEEALAVGTPLRDTLAGPFARWIALHAIAVGSVAGAKKQLNQLCTDLDNYDALDRAEILAARYWLDRQASNSVTLARLRAQHQRLADQLSALPTAVVQQLARLSILDTTLRT
jgi:hypothetical protein